MQQQQASLVLLALFIVVVPAKAATRATVARPMVSINFFFIISFEFVFEVRGCGKVGPISQTTVNSKDWWGTGAQIARRPWGSQDRIRNRNVSTNCDRRIWWNLKRQTWPK